MTDEQVLRAAELVGELNSTRDKIRAWCHPLVADVPMWTWCAAAGAFAGAQLVPIAAGAAIGAAAWYVGWLVRGRHLRQRMRALLGEAEAINAAAIRQIVAHAPMAGAPMIHVHRPPPN